MLVRVKRGFRRVAGAYSAARRRHGWLDHVSRAAVQYDRVNGGRLAASVTYHAFLAVFPVLLVGYSVLGYLVGWHATVTAEVSAFLASYLPTLDVERIAEARYTAGIVGVIGIIYAGVGWVESLRTAIRAMWGKEETPGNWILAWFVDVGVLLAVGLVIAISIAVSVVLSSGFGWGLEQLGVGSGPLRTALAFAIGVLVDVVVFATLLTGLPRLRMPFGRVFMPALIGATGFELLKTFSQIFLGYTTRNPAYAVVAGAAGLLVFINLLNQLLLFCAALTATSERGEVRERRALGARRPELKDDEARRAPVDAPTGGRGV